MWLGDLWFGFWNLGFGPSLRDQVASARDETVDFLCLGGRMPRLWWKWKWPTTTAGSYSPQNKGEAQKVPSEGYCAVFLKAGVPVLSTALIPQDVYSTFFPKGLPNSRPPAH